MRLTREQTARDVGRAAQADRARLTRGAGDELLEPLELDLHRAADATREQRRDHVDRVEIEAPAEVAADRRLQHAHTVAGDAERARQVALVQEGHLRGGPHRQLALRVPLRDGDHGFQAARRHEVQPVRALDDDRRLGKRAIDVAVTELVAQIRVIVRALVVHARRARAERLGRLEDGRQLLVLHVDQCDRLLGDGRRFGGDGSDLVADAPDLPRLERGLIAGEAEPVLLDVGGGQHGEHAGQRGRASRVDADETRVRMGRSQNLAVGEPRQDEVVQVTRPPRHLLGSVLLRRRLADDSFWGPRHGPQTPNARTRPGGAVARLGIA